MKISISAFKHRSPEEIKALPEFSIGVAEEVFKLNSTIYIDNKDGLGATPDNQNVLYKGCITIMKIDDYFKLAKPDPNVTARVPYMAQKIKEGFGFGNPCFYMDIDGFVDEDATPPEIKGHEGRARCKLFKDSGITEIPVQFLFNGYRARHVQDHSKFLTWMNSGIKDERGVETYRNLFHKFLFA